MSTESSLGLEYWLQWQVGVCALIFIIPTLVAVRLINKRRDTVDPLKPSDLWIPCWRNLHPLSLLCFRAFSFLVMSFLLYQTVSHFGFFVFFFYTQYYYYYSFFILLCNSVVLQLVNSSNLLSLFSRWTFALVVVYFAVGTFISARGCWFNSTSGRGEREKFVKAAGEENSDGTINSQAQASSDQPLGFWENLMQIVYQISAGASMLTDIVFWCLLLPFMTGENFKLTVLIGCMHSVNAIFLVLDSLLNNLQFTWFGLTYFVLWSVCYIIFQWSLHACCLSWWPYPFLELKTPFAPLWYLGLALVHIPCYGIYALLIKAKGSVFSRLFPQAFISGCRIATEKKHT